MVDEFDNDLKELNYMKVYDDAENFGNLKFGEVLLTVSFCFKEYIVEDNVVDKLNEYLISRVILHCSNIL